MERHVLCVKVSCGKTVLELMNTHLESLAEHADERRRQFATCNGIISELPDTRTVILAGDMNMEETWLGEAEIGTLPANIEVSMMILADNLLFVRPIFRCDSISTIRV